MSQLSSSSSSVKSNGIDIDNFDVDNMSDASGNMSDVSGSIASGNSTPRGNFISSLDLSSHYLSSLMYSNIFPALIKGLKTDKGVDVDEHEMLEWLSIPAYKVSIPKIPSNKNSFPSVKKKSVTNRGRKPRKDKQKCSAILERHPNAGKKCTMYCKNGEIYCPNHCKKYLTKENSKMKKTSPNIEFSPPVIMTKKDIKLPHDSKMKDSSSSSGQRSIPKPMDEPIAYPDIPKSPKEETIDKLDLPEIPDQY